MSWREHTERGKETVRYSYWLTPEGAAEACEMLTTDVEGALRNKDGLWNLIKPGWAWNPVSPVALAFKDGLRKIPVNFNDKDEVVRMQYLLNSYLPKTVIAAAVFASPGCKVDISTILNPAEAKRRSQQFDDIFNMSKEGARSPGDIMDNMQYLLSGDNDWELLTSTEGRIMFFVERTRQVVENPTYLKEAIDRMPRDYDLSRSVALSFEHLFS
jgi:hypothetical protein